MNYTNETLTSLPFSQLIGSPLTAAIEAQSLAAKATVDFINAVGFKPIEEGDPMFGTELDGTIKRDSNVGEVRNIVFSYTTTNPDGSTKNSQISVPILSILPIPYIRIESMSIDFTANITETIEYSTTSQTDTTKEGEFSSKLFWSPVKVALKGTVSSSKNSSSSSKYKTEYTMGIHVTAVQDSMPSGLLKVLNILENSAIQTSVVSDASLIIFSSIEINETVTLKKNDVIISTGISKNNKIFEFAKIKADSYDICIGSNIKTNLPVNQGVNTFELK